MSSSAYSDHIFSRIKADINFLTSQNLLNQNDQDLIIQRLDAAASVRRAVPPPPLAANTVDTLSNQLSNTGFSPSPSHHGSAPPVPPPRRETARALWAYGGSQPDDLTFNKGDVIIVHVKDNDHWWRGSVMNEPSGRVGLFPSNHVEIFGAGIDASQQLAVVPSNYPASQPGSYYGQSDQEKAALQAYHAPPPPMQQQQQHYQPPPPQPYYQQPPQQHAVAPPIPSPADPEKKNKFKIPGKGSGMGNTLAHSFVGGTGFGAGSAIAGNIVNSILH